MIRWSVQFEKLVLKRLSKNISGKVKQSSLLFHCAFNFAFPDFLPTVSQINVPVLTLQKRCLLTFYFLLSYMRTFFQTLFVIVAQYFWKIYLSRFPNKCAFRFTIHSSTFPPSPHHEHDEGSGAASYFIAQLYCIIETIYNRMKWPNKIYLTGNNIK